MLCFFFFFDWPYRTKTWNKNTWIANVMVNLGCVQERAAREVAARRHAGGLGLRSPGTFTHRAWCCHWSLETAITWEVPHPTELADVHTCRRECIHLRKWPHSSPCLTLKEGSLLFQCFLYVVPNDPCQQDTPRLCSLLLNISAREIEERCVLHVCEVLLYWKQSS